MGRIKSRYILTDFGGFDWIGSLDPTEDQLYIVRFLSRWRKGSHHLYGKVETCSPTSVVLKTRLTPATFDFNELTTLVILAHKYHVRVEIVPCMNILKLMCHRRKPKGETSSTWEYHPSLSDLAAMIEKELPKNEN